MPFLVLLLTLPALALSLPLTLLVRTLSHRLNAHDSAGVPGQVKTRRRIPNTGGIAIFLSFALAFGAALIACHLPQTTLDALLAPLGDKAGAALATHLPGIREQTPLATKLLLSLTLLHVLGLIDDRRPLGPFLKLAIMAAPAVFIAATTDTRLLTLLDSRVGGPWLSIAITVLWFLVVTNAMNFMDNMDGLSPGVGAIASACLLTLTVIHGQWFVAACLALLLGALLGFLVFNFPWRRRDDAGATIFMGDGGSLVLGFLLAFLTTRTTYLPADFVSSPPPHSPSPPWYAVLVPLLILAVPLYDFTSVVILRLSQGRSPFVGDQQHLSHRTVRRGLSKRTAVLVIYLFTAATGLAAIPLPSLESWQAALVGLQAAAIIAALALFEWAEFRDREEKA